MQAPASIELIPDVYELHFFMHVPCTRVFIPIILLLERNWTSYLGVKPHIAHRLPVSLCLLIKASYLLPISSDLTDLMIITSKYTHITPSDEFATKSSTVSLHHQSYFLDAKSALSYGLFFTEKSEWSTTYTVSLTVSSVIQAAKNGINPESNREWARGQVGQLLGDNSRHKRSFVVGFGENPPERPHHRSR